MTKGLVLAGGGTLGAYEVGVINYLNEKNMKFDVVTGSSIGAVIAALYAAHQEKEIQAMWDRINAEMIMKNGVNINAKIFDNFSLNKLKSVFASYGYLKGADITPFKEYCKQMINVSAIKESNIKCGIIVSSLPLLKKEKILLNNLPENYILPYIHASSACYPLFPIETIDNKKYVDGGYRDNLPIDYCFELGADEILAINLPLPNMNLTKNYMQNLPNVKVIQPTKMAPSMMDFEQEEIQKKIKWGYLDAKHFFGELYGKNYYIAPFRNAEVFGRKIICYLIKNDEMLLKKIIIEKLSTSEIFYYFIEQIADNLKLPIYQEYNVKEIISQAKSQNILDNKYLKIIQMIKENI